MVVGRCGAADKDILRLPPDIAVLLVLGRSRVPLRAG